MANISPIMNNPSVKAVSAPSAADPTTAAAVASTHGGKNVSSNTTINSLKDLKHKAPQVYNMMMMGIASNICREMQHHQDKLKQLMREGQRQT